jgi:RNA polymerase sigma-70 factor (sigma-E family)
LDRYEGFAAFVHARGRALARTAYLLTGDHQHAEDLLQAALAKAAMRWPSIVGGSPEAYIRRILYTQNVSIWRRRRGREVLSAEPPDPRAGGPDPRAGGPDPADATAVRLAVEQALARLTRRQRTILVLRYFEDLTEAQTAQVLGIAVGTVKSQTRDSLARLRAVAPDLADLVGRHPTGERRPTAPRRSRPAVEIHQ